MVLGRLSIANNGVQVENDKIEFFTDSSLSKRIAWIDKTGFYVEPGFTADDAAKRVIRSMTKQIKCVVDSAIKEDRLIRDTKLFTGQKRMPRCK